MRSNGNTISKIGLLFFGLLLPALMHADAGQYVAWGDQMLAKKQYDSAAKYYGAALRADPKSAPAYRGLGYSYMGKRDATHGEQYLEYSLRLNPYDKSVRSYLGRLYQGYGNQYYHLGNKPLAINWWNKSLTIDPSNTSLSAYVASLRTPAPVATVGAPTSTQATQNAESVGPAPGINPWIMGGTIAVLGTIMIFLF